MSQNDTTPPVSGELLRWLEGVFSDRLPATPQTDLAAVNVKIGEQRVLTRLRQVHNEQRDNALSGRTS